MTDTAAIRLTKQESRAMLAPHSKHFQEMVIFVQEQTDEKLAELKAACEWATDSNCGWDIYAAARYLEKEAAGEIRRRAHADGETDGGKDADRN